MEAIETAGAVQIARMAQGRWAATPVQDRLRMIDRLRPLLAAEGLALATLLGTIGHGRDPAESLSAEIIPLADAALFLVRRAAHLLAPRKLGPRGRPGWLFGVGAEVRREPVGLVLILCPGNYPLLLAGVQLLQALAAGNGVLLKPAPGSAAPLVRLLAFLAEAGLPEGLVHMLPDSVAAGQQAMGQGVDLVLLTGSTETGRRVLAQAAERPIPVIAELGGQDPVFLLPGADLGLAARAIAYGMRLNSGATCIAPRRVLGPAAELDALAQRLIPLLAELPSVLLPPGPAALVRTLLSDLPAESVAGGFAADGRFRPAVVRGPPGGSRLLDTDAFAPLLILLPAETAAGALELAAASPYRLGASIFGPEAAARDFAGSVQAGTVIVNDVIVPTADPRLPFGGRGDSGFGVTRGSEGLLALTVPKVVAWRPGRFRPHYDLLQPQDAALFQHYLQAAHGRSGRLAATIRLLRGLARRPR